MRDEDDMRAWLKERQDRGLEGVGASLVGNGKVHDLWNGRKGDFEFLMMAMRVAAELGLKHGATIYLTKSVLPLIDETVELIAQRIPTPQNSRHFRPFYYIGHAAHHEAERLDEADIDRLPSYVKAEFSDDWVFRSERQWIEHLLKEPPSTRKTYLRLELDTRNIAALEARSCDDIFSDMESRARATLAQLPTTEELMERYGDRESTKIYPGIVDIDRVWINRHLDANSIEYDRKLLHYHLGKSLKPPRLSLPR
ncbi:MAG: hypothetical protein WDO56_05250 [Gammaproteobacteria bacterium]